MQGSELDAWVESVARDWRGAELTVRERALCTFAEALTLAPARMRALHLEALRSAGLDELECHDAIQVVSYFNYINRVADAAHVDLEPQMQPYPEEGADA